MARKKKDEIEELAEKLTDYGPEFQTARSILENPRHIIPFSPALDWGLSGGIPEGSWVIINGPEKVGKTTAALHFAANCQKPENGSREVFYYDIEGRLRERNIKGVPHLNLDKFHLMQSSEDTKYCAEDFLNSAIKRIKSTPKCVIIIDCWSNLITKQELDKGLGETSQTTLQAKLCTDFVKQTCQDVSANNIILIGITQNMANPSRFGSGKSEKVATAIKYQGDVKIEATKKTDRGVPTGKKVKGFDGKEKDVLNIIGQIVHWTVVFSALGPPFRKVDGIITFGKGIDEVAEILNMGSEIGIIDKGGGGNYTLNIGGEEIKIKGQKNVDEYLQNNPDVVEELKQQIVEALS
jgi:recombination protein RecA